MSVWTHVNGAVHIYAFANMSEIISRFMKENFKLIPKGSEGPIDYYANVYSKPTAFDQESVFGAYTITFAGHLRDITEHEFCEGFEKFLKKCVYELPCEMATFSVNDDSKRYVIAYTQTEDRIVRSKIEKFSIDIPKEIYI